MCVPLGVTFSISNLSLSSDISSVCFFVSVSDENDRLDIEKVRTCKKRTTK